MAPNAERVFLRASVAKLRQLASRIDACVTRLTPEQIWWRANENANAVGNLCLHLAGNLGELILHWVGGQPDTRQRDAEFDASGGLAPAELRTRLHAAVEAACDVLENFPPHRLVEPVPYRGNLTPVLEIVLITVEHFAQHTGQIIYVTKELTGQELGLTVPRKR
jgi:uncharacterized damage-inducible protein DinB